MVTSDPYNLFSISEKVCLITGGSKGLGGAISEGFLQAGASVVIACRSKTPLVDDLLSRFGKDRVYFMEIDLMDSTSLSSLVGKVLEWSGRVDVLVNNAGHQSKAPILSYSSKQWHEDVSLLLTAPFELARQCVQQFMLKSGGGKIINLASISSFQSAKNIVGYAACKHAIVGLTKSMANEWAGHNINVNAIAPGIFKTAMNDDLFADSERFSIMQSRVPAGQFGEPNDLVGSAIFLASNASRHVHGHVLVVDGGWLGR